MLSALKSVKSNFIPNEEKLIIPQGLDCRDPRQRDPFRPKSSGASNILGGLAGQAAAQDFNRMAQMQGARSGQLSGQSQSPFRGIFGGLF